MSGDNLEKSQNLYKLNMSPFKNLGRGRSRNKVKKYKKSPFKNIKWAIIGLQQLR